MKLILDFLPLAVFFIAYKINGLMLATSTLIATTLLCLVISYVIERKIAVTPLITGIVVTIFGALTLILHDNTFIKMKPTFINLLFATILCGGLIYKKPLLKPLLQSALSLTDTGWRQLTYRWMLFFIFLAATNEVIWRNFDEAFWVNFKVFGMMPLTLIFMAFQYPLIKRHYVETN